MSKGQLVILAGHYLVPRRFTEWAAYITLMGIISHFLGYFPMSSSRMLSPFSAIIININVMLGIGIFINTVELTKRAGAYSFLAYITVGLLMLPLIISIARLVRIYPDGGFYSYARQELGNAFGFLSGWSYFTGKLGSGAIVLHTAVKLIQHLIVFLQPIPTLALDCLLVIAFVALNLLNMRTGSAIQGIFLVGKMVPVFFVILVGLFLFQPEHLIRAPIDFQGIGSSLALAVFAFIGFEVACSISNKIENPQKNAPRVILTSYAIVITILSLYQLIFFGVLGTSLMAKTSYLQALPGFLQVALTSSPLFAAALVKILHLSFAVSALGGSYGTMFSNGWNLYVLAQNQHIFFDKLFTWLNRNAIPVACFIAEGIIILSYLFISNGNQVPLQQLGVIGCIFAYTISVLSLIVGIIRKKHRFPLWIPILGVCNCLLLTTIAVQGILVSGPASLLLFLGLNGLGIGMFWIKKLRSNSLSLS